SIGESPSEALQLLPIVEDFRKPRGDPQAGGHARRHLQTNAKTLCTISQSITRPAPRTAPSYPPRNQKEGRRDHEWQNRDRAGPDDGAATQLEPVALGRARSRARIRSFSRAAAPAAVDRRRRARKARHSGL